MISSFVDRLIEPHTEKRIEQFIKRDATHPDGSVDEGRAAHIRLELTRREAMGKQLDIIEPAGWAAEQVALTVAAGAAIKAAHVQNLAAIRPILWTLAGTSALSAGIQLVRMPTRYDAGLRGGEATALAMDAIDKAQAAGRQPNPAIGSWTNYAPNAGKAFASSR